MTQDILFCNSGFLLKPAVIYKDTQKWLIKVHSNFTNEDQLTCHRELHSACKNICMPSDALKELLRK